MTWKTYLITQALGVAAFNTACNAGYTWLLWHDQDVMRYGAIAVDLALTPVWIGLLSVLLGTPFIRKALADGRMMQEAGIGAPRFARLIPRHLLLRGIAGAGLCAVLFALPLALLLPLMGDGAFSPADAIGIKALITIVFSLIIVPLVAMATTGDTAQSQLGLSGSRG